MPAVEVDGCFYNCAANFSKNPENIAGRSQETKLKQKLLPPKTRLTLVHSGYHLAPHGLR